MLQSQEYKKGDVLAAFKAARKAEDKKADIKISAIAAIGGDRGRDRIRYFEMFKSDGFLTPNIIHPTSHINESALLGENNQLCAFSFLDGIIIEMLGVFIFLHCRPEIPKYRLWVYSC